MPSNEERREAAQRFRAIDYGSLKESLICAFLDAIGESGYLDWVGIANSIADLIEPEPERTCHVESSRTEWEDGEYSYLEVELSCGHAFTWDDCTPPDYCPNCGAEVVG